MIRQILTVVVPLLAPTIAYIVYLYFTAKNREAEMQGRTLPEWRRWPWFTLVPAGALLAALSIAILGLPGNSDDPANYVPPHMKNGEIVPGGFKN